MIALIQTRLSQLQDLCLAHHVARLELFGSSTGCTFNPEKSDLDFIVEFQPMSPVDRADNYFALLEGLEQLFERPIDLVEIACLTNPYFVAAIRPSREVLYAA
jgi:predicted nucleotidyltransferase